MNECYFDKSIDIENVRIKQLELAEEVKRVCDKYGIRYFIIWGTLLGAIRNEGYIPWDDDFDIALFREDYTKFIKLAVNEFKDPFFLQTALSDKLFFFPYARLRNSNTTGIITADYSCDYNNGIFVDIYPLDAIPTRNIVKKFKFFMRDIFYSICSEYFLVKNGKKTSVFEKLLGCCFSYEYLCRIFDDICKIGNKCDCEIVGLAYSRTLCKKYKFKKSYAENTCDLKFEDHTFSAPKDYKDVLREVYGNYNKLPPKRKRGRWHEGQIIYDPHIPYKEYILKTHEKT